jgi:5,10-methylene-tetrahydrofolate dehydrogenase/methenyl tetrahydrofolate cyclohydrolase
MIFDGKAFARQIEEQVKSRVEVMDIKPKIVSIIVGDDPASVLYTRLKKQAAERVGIIFEVQKYTNVQAQELIQNIEEIGAREDVTGVMVQLPMAKNFKGRTLKVLEAIPLDKDVDGLRWEESKIVPATVKAVLGVLKRVQDDVDAEVWSKRFVVLGSRGAVGRPLVHFLREKGVEVSEVEWDTPKDEVMQKCINAQVLISCVGKPETVTGEMVREGMIAIDVGAPKGDMTQGVYDKCSVAVAVPNGVGPVTIACLLENAVEIYGSKT